MELSDKIDPQTIMMFHACLTVSDPPGTSSEEPRQRLVRQKCETIGY